MSSILVFISSKALNSPPRQICALADPPRYLNQEIKWWTDMRQDFHDAAMDFNEVEEFGNVSGWARLRYVVYIMCHIILIARQTCNTCLGD